MQDDRTVLSAIREYILTCPFLHDGAVNIGYLGDRIEYSIDPLPVTPVVKTYADGGKLKQYAFTFTSREAFDGDARTALDGSGFYEDFELWIEKNDLQDILPELPEGKQSQTIEVTTGGYIFDIAAEKARYQIQCRLIYLQEVI